MAPLLHHGWGKAPQYLGRSARPRTLGESEEVCNLAQGPARCTGGGRFLNIIKREQDALKVGEVALQVAREHLELEQVAQAMLEVEHVEAYRAARRAVHTTQLNASRQLNYAYGMQTKIEQGEDKKKAQEEKAQLDKEELAKVGPYIAWAARNIAANAVANIVRNARESDRVKLAAEKRKAFLATFM